MQASCNFSTLTVEFLMMEKGFLSVQRLTKGTLHTLQKLEETADKLCGSVESESKQQRQLAVLQKEVQTLRAKRDQLKKDLKNTPWKVLRSSVLEETDDGQLHISEEDCNDSQDAVLQAVIAAQIVKAQHMLTHTYRLTGSSVTSLMKGKRKHIRICWDTFCGGQYCEPYYMELQTARNDNNLVISRHSLPYFLPLSNLRQDLNKDIAGFVKCIRDFLNAYVCRRQQAFTLQNKHKAILDGEVHASASFDNMTFDLKLTYQDTPCIAAITVIYDDLLFIQPSRVDVTIKDGKLARSSCRKLCNQLKSVMTSHPIHVAVDTL